MTKITNIITLREQITKRIANYRTTLEGIGDDNTEWHQKQKKILESRIAELEWMLEILPEPKPFSIDWHIEEGTEDRFLESTGFFQRDEHGLFSYISQNGKHMSNLVALLEDYKEHLKSKK